MAFRSNGKYFQAEAAEFLRQCDPTATHLSSDDLSHLADTLWKLMPLDKVEPVAFTAALSTYWSKNEKVFNAAFATRDLASIGDQLQKMKTYTLMILDIEESCLLGQTQTSALVLTTEPHSTSSLCASTDSVSTASESPSP